MTQAIFTFTDNTYCLGIWFCEREDCDWLAAVTREGDEPLQLTYRIRYYADDKHFNSDDEKSAWTVNLESLSEEDIIKVVDGMVDALLDQGFSDLWKRIVRGDSAKALETLKMAPFTKVRALPVH